MEHNLWNYIHFVLYLDTLHPNDHNALEKYVSQQVHEYLIALIVIISQVPSISNPAGSTDFFPIFKAKCLPKFDITKV